MEDLINLKINLTFQKINLRLLIDCEYQLNLK